MSLFLLHVQGNRLVFLQVAGERAVARADQSPLLEQALYGTSKFFD